MVVKRDNPARTGSGLAGVRILRLRSLRIRLTVVSSDDQSHHFIERADRHTQSGATEAQSQSGDRDLYRRARRGAGDETARAEFPDWHTMQGMVRGGDSLTQALEAEHRAELARDDARLQGRRRLGAAGLVAR